MKNCKIPKNTTNKQKARAFDLLLKEFPELREKFCQAVKVAMAFN